MTSNPPLEGTRRLAVVIVAGLLALGGAAVAFWVRAPAPTSAAPEPSVRVFASEPAGGAAAGKRQAAERRPRARGGRRRTS